MGEKKGFLTVLLIFTIFVLPFLLQTFIAQVEGQKIMGISTEIQQLVQTEGGVSSNVQNVVNKLSEKGIEITFYDDEGNTINSQVPVGKRINIHYKFKDWETMNSVVNLKRN